MAMITHPQFGFAIGDPDRALFNLEALPSQAELSSALDSMILSASGWRKVFAASGDEEGLEEEVRAADLLLCAGMASVFADFILARGGKAVLLGVDSRPTGPLMAEAMLRTFIAKGLAPRYLYIVAAPEIMAYARSTGEEDAVAGFCYVSASHNPPGHNGVKFGLSDGGVVGGEESKALVAAFRALVAKDGSAGELAALCAKAPRAEVARALSDAAQRWKRRAASAYNLFSREVVSGSPDRERQEALFDELQASLAKRPLGLLAEFNGSARCLSVDEDFLVGAGFLYRKANAVPRAFAHRIVPEGASLDQARELLDRARAEDGRFELAYVPDCDGDRGNIVFFDESIGSSRALAAQEVFSLACLSELACMLRTGELRHDGRGNAQDKVALVVNDPTSMRIDEIAARFDVDVFRAEVGEANVVALARALRGKGYAVRVLGEGSNGGLIVHPSAVRDPLDTLLSVAKLLRLPDTTLADSPFRAWLGLSGRLGSYRKDYGLSEVIASLPDFATTSAFEDEAALRISTGDQAALKGRYQRIFLREWEEKRAGLAARFGYESWEAIAYRGTEEKKGLADFAEAGTGGLKIAFKDGAGRPLAFMWMRGSGTEPVLRILADAAGGGKPGRALEAERALLAWQAAMVREADRG